MRAFRPTWARWLAVIAVLAMFATSCGSDGDSSAAEQDETEVLTETEVSTEGDSSADTDSSAGADSSDTEEAAAAEPEEKEPVTIKWFMRWDQTRVDNVALPVIAEFEAANPHITVEFENIGSSSEYYQKLQTSVAGGTVADVFYPATHIAYSLGSKGAIRPIDDLAAASGMDMGAFDQNILDLYKIDGQQMCLPIDTASLVVFYNKDLFDAAGVAYPEAGWTWDDFLETAKALTTDDDSTDKVFGVETFVNYWPMMVWSETGHSLFDDPRDPSEWLINNQESIGAVQWLADLSVVHGVMPDAIQRADIGDMFSAQKAAMNVVGHWRVPRYADLGEFNFGFAELPVGPTGPLNRADGSCFAVSSASDHPEEAWQFVQFLAGPGSAGVESLLELQQMTPVITEFQSAEVFLSPPGLEDANAAAFLAGKENLFSMYDPLHPMYGEWDALWKQELSEVWLGNTTAQDAFDYMAPIVDDMLANLDKYE